ncbi:GTPase HflX [Alphaproteobacteria bacterium LMG 31809]|uniref:GTPase HflX n=1 Tax=Govanella unica TaxID=2975056 RepID=A0A9X3Z7C2_9PROT|nr:GTPase HflX [Govania unica]
MKERQGRSALERATVDVATRLPEAQLAEAISLAEAIDLDVREAIIVGLSGPKPSTYLGSGKVEEVGELIEAREIDLVVVDCELMPRQQRNLEKAWGVKVIDRTGLILEIFGARAQTREGRLQVELAHLTYQKSRLVRSWTHLERQRGGTGFLGGPGETQIEADRRMLDDRIIKLKKQLETVVRTRGLHRRARQKVPYPVVALVGYTNAGKSTLFNRLTAADVMAEDMLFATLDPTMRRVRLPSGRLVILSDTVGFVSNLPTHLVAAFRATLEEVVEADVIVHVRDIAHPESDAQARDVTMILKDLSVEEDAEHVMIEGLNKTDLLDEDARMEVLGRTGYGKTAVALSALTGAGVESLLRLVEDQLASRDEEREIVIASEDGAMLAWIYAHGQVLDRMDGEDGVHLHVRLAAADWGRYEKERGAVSTKRPRQKLAS